MNKKSTLLLLIILFVFSFPNVFSQETKTEKQPLIPILKILEHNYNISFSYADVTVKDKTTSAIIGKALSLKEVLSLIEKETGLKFKVLNNRFIAITSPQIDKQNKQNALNVQELDEISISNFLTSGISKTGTGTINIKPKGFGILPGLIEPDILQAIQALPGILSNNETVSTLNVRGGTHNQNLILWDGIKMYQSGHFFGLISGFSPYLTKSVLVAKNGTSAAFGDGVSSTIDIQLDDLINTDFTSGLGVNLLYADGFVKIPLNHNLEIQASLRHSVTGLKTPTYDQFFDRILQNSDITDGQTNPDKTISIDDTFYFYDFGIKILHDISEKDKLRFNFITMFNTLDYLEKDNSTAIENISNNGISQSNLAAGLSYNRQWSDRLSTDIHFYSSNYTLKATDIDVTNNQRLIQQNEVLDTGIRVQADYILSDNLKWTNGYQYTEVGVTNFQDINTPAFTSNIKEVLRTHSEYSEISFLSNSKKTVLRAGLRSNYFDKFNKLILEPRLSFTQQLFKHIKVEVLGEYKNQATSQRVNRQNDFLGIDERRWVLANNTTIPIIESKQASIGLHYNKNKLFLSAEAFYKQVDGIKTRSQGFQNQFQFINAIGSYRVRGIDFLVNKRFTNTSAWLSYSLSNNDYTFSTLNNGEAFPNNLDIRHTVTFAGTYSINNLKFALGVNWRSGKAITEPVEGNEVFDGAINYNSPNSSNLSDYFRTDFSTTYDFDFTKKTKAKIGLSVWNVFNKSNSLNRIYILEDDNTVTEVETKSLGITPNLSFRVKF